MDELFDLANLAQRHLWIIGLGMARLTPIFIIVPFLGRGNLSALTRGAIVFALAVFLRPWLDLLAPPGMPSMGYLMPIVAKEAVLGALFGVVSSFAFEAAAGIGFIIDNQRGLSMAQTTDPLTGEETSPLGSMLMQTLVMVFVATGGLQLFFHAVVTTYAFWSPFAYWPDWSSVAVRELLLGQFSWYLVTMTTLAAPILLVIFLVDLGMGLMNRFAPQLNVFFMSMPIKSAFAILVLLVYWAGLFEVLGTNALRLPVLWDAFMQDVPGLLERG